MNPIFAAILSGLAKSFEAAGQGFLVTTLQGWQVKNPAEYAADVPVLHAILKRVKGVTDATATKIDDAFVDAFLGALEASAAANGITL